MELIKIYLSYLQRKVFSLIGKKEFFLFMPVINGENQNKAI